MDDSRPISILPVISKFAEKVVYLQLFGYLNANNLLSPYQSRFSKNFFAETAVTFFVDEIRRYMDNVFSLDPKKAFDTIDHYILLNKLQRCGVCDKTLLCFSSSLQGRSQRVAVDKVFSTPLDITSGVPQGSILGHPALFILHKWYALL